MAKDTLTVYIPQEKLKEEPLARLMRLAKRQDRSVNYLVVRAILEYLDRAEQGGAREAVDESGSWSEEDLQDLSVAVLTHAKRTIWAER